jgi:DNA polymerase I-like protein with 3'-5' exonuclease and polymerase domains
MESLPSSWKGVKRLGLDVESKDEDIQTLGPGVRRPGNRVVGLSFAFEDGPAHYLPWGHEGGDNMPEDNCKAYLRDKLREFDGEMVGANLPYELDWLWSPSMNMPTPNVKRYLDVQIADPLIYELHFSYKLQKIAERRGFAGKDETLLREAAANYGIDPKKELWRLPARYVGAYATEDAVLPLKIMRKQEREIERDELERVFDLESRLLPVLVRMRQRGIAINFDRLDSIERWCILEEQKAIDEIKFHTNINLGLDNCNAASKLAPIMNAAGLEMGTTNDGKDSVTSGQLDSMDHPVANAIKRARQVNKVRGTFVASIRRHAVNGRIHCNYNQLRKSSDDTDDENAKGVKFGRLSCDSPNMQQQPGRDEEIGPLWRSIFVPDEGMLFCSNDYSQQEPRWSFHFSEMMKLDGAKRICDIFRNDPTADCYDPLASAAGIKRKAAKIVWLARCYGQGGGKMAQNLGLPTRMITIDKQNNWARIPLDTPRGRECEAMGSYTWLDAGEECQKIIDAFDKEMPFLKRAAKIAEGKAKENQYVKTILGRRCHFPTAFNGDVEGAYRAFNRAIQGSSADQTKEAVVQLDAAGFPLQLQVHDEINLSVRSKGEAEEAADIMRNAITMRVPVRVDTEVGTSWGHSMVASAKPEVLDAYLKQCREIFREAA